MAWDDDLKPADVTLLDARTGRTVVSREAKFYPFQWAENNWSCDCNRDCGFPDHPDDPPFEEWMENHCAGCHRFLVVAIEPFPEGYYELAEYNENYPDELRALARDWLSLTAEEQIIRLAAVRHLTAPT